MEKYKDIYGVLMLNRLGKVDRDPIYPKNLNHFDHHTRSLDSAILYYPVDNPYDFLFQTYWETFFNDSNDHLL